MEYPTKKRRFRRWKYTPKSTTKRMFLKTLDQRIQNVAGKKPNNQQPIENGNASVVSWNTEGKGTPEEVDKILLATQKLRPDFVLLQNATLPAAGNETEHFKWYCSGEVGSAVLVHKESKWEVSDHNQVCQQIVVVKAIKEDTRLALTSCYIPPATDYHCKDIWNKFIDVLKDIPSNLLNVIGGDFNAQIGQKQENELYNIWYGQLLYHEHNDVNGTKLLEVAKKAHLRITSTFAAPNVTKESFFTYQDGETKTLQDYIILPISRANGHSGHVYLKWAPEYKHAMSSCHVYVGVSTRKRIADRIAKTPEVEMVVSSWNIQGATPSKVDTIVQEQELQVVCLQELFLTSEEDIQSELYTWYSSKRQWAKNVGIMVKKSPDIVVNEFTVISENLCVADMVYHNRPVKVVSCHLPAPTDPRHETVAVQLSDLVKSMAADTCFVVAGDFDVRGNFKDGKTGKDDGNLSVLQKLVEETKITLVSSVWASNRCPFLASKTEGFKISTKPYGKRISFFENNISCLRVFFVEKSVPSPPSFDFEGNLVTRCSREETVNGVVHKINTIEYLDPTGETGVSEEEGTVKPAAEDVEKYASKAPTVSELGRIMKDFVLYNGVSDQSVNFKSKLQLLAMSFIRGNFGRLTTEHRDVMGTGKDQSSSRGISRILWNGMVLSETMATGSEQKTMRRQNANFLYSKLGQHFYQVKAKTSFFCKGQLPMLMDDPKYSELFQKVEKTKYPTMPEVFKYIEDFFVKDSDTELVFGVDFTKEELEEIREFAKSHKLGYRFFASKAADKVCDHITVFIRRSPQYLRDKLMESKEDAKYMLIPPSGLGENYDRHVVKYEVDHFKEEEKLMQKFWKSIRAERNEKKGINEGVETTQPAADSTKSPITKPVKQTQGKDSTKSPATKPIQKTQGKVETPVRRDNKPGRRARGNKRLNVDYSNRDDPSRFRQDFRQPLNGRHEAEDVGPPPIKRQRHEQSDDLPPKITWNIWQSTKPLLIVWPITICSRLEDRSRLVLEANFNIEYFQDHQGSVAVVVRLPMRNGNERRFSVSVAETKNRAADFALQKLLKHSTVIKPNPAYLCDGAAPNFIRYKVPCQTYPRTYIILSQYDTGPLSLSGIRNIFETFKSSFNEDLFFDKEGYTFNEKMMIIEEAPKYQLNVRHFGDVPGVINRYVCVYKTRPKEQILEEVLKMRGAHPKYTITTDRLPPYLGLNVF